MRTSRVIPLGLVVAAAAVALPYIGRKLRPVAKSVGDQLVKAGESMQKMAHGEPTIIPEGDLGPEAAKAAEAKKKREEAPAPTQAPKQPTKAPKPVAKVAKKPSKPKPKRPKAA